MTWVRVRVANKLAIPKLGLVLIDLIYLDIYITSHVGPLYVISVPVNGVWFAESLHIMVL